MLFSKKEIAETLEYMADLAISMGLDNGVVMLAWREADGMLYEAPPFIIGKGQRDSQNGDPGRVYWGTAREKLSFSLRTQRDSGEYPDCPAKLGELGKKGCSRLEYHGAEIFFICSGFHNDTNDAIVSDSAKQRFLR